MIKDVFIQISLLRIHLLLFFLFSIIIFTPFVKQIYIYIYIQIFPERMLNGKGHIIVKTN